MLVMAGTTYCIRMLPLVLLRKKIQNAFVLSFLYYAPYAVLGAMTFPAILYATSSVWASFAGLMVSFVAAYRNAPMMLVAVLGSVSAIAMQLCLQAF